MAGPITKHSLPHYPVAYFPQLLWSVYCCCFAVKMAPNTVFLWAFLLLVATVAAYVQPPPPKAHYPPVKSYTPPPPKAAAPPVVKPSYPPKAPSSSPVVVKPSYPPAPPTAHSPPGPIPFYSLRPPLKDEECPPLCKRRCMKHTWRSTCERSCNTCCRICKCVPPGLFVNKEQCGRCYIDMTTHGGKPKCP